MKFQSSPLTGVMVIDPEFMVDERGFFARTWCREEWTKQGLNPDLVQCSVSFNHRKGTLRGMHYQRAPHGEVKLVRCTRGAIYDVVVDMRTDSPSYRQWFATELTAENHRMLLIPEGVAHGFLTLRDDSEVFYQMSNEFHPAAAVGFRWNDPLIGMQWPLEVSVISDRDRDWPLLT